jgi:YD repeat-containing protein
MKKIIVLVILLFSCILISCSQEDYTNKSEREKRKGYKEAKVYIYEYKFGEIDKESKVLYQHITYDNEGNIETESQFQNYTKEYTKTVYKYNKANMPIERTSYGSDGKRMDFNITRYYPGDTIIAESASRDNNGIMFFENKYDERGNEIFFAAYLDKQHRIHESIYNDKNQLVKTISRHGTLNNKGEMVFDKPKTKNYIDEHGNTIDLGYDESNYDKLEREYNEKSQLIEKKRGSTTVKYKYNKKGLLEEETTYENGEPISTYIYEYK